MKLPPLRLLLLCLCSGLLSGFDLPDYAQSLPGIFFGLFFLIWLPTKEEPTALKRAGMVLASGTAYFAAFHLAVWMVADRHMSDWQGYFCAGLLGAILLHLTLAVAGTISYSHKKLLYTALSGALLGLIFSIPIHTDSKLYGAILSGGYYAFWQLGMGVVLYNQTSERNGT